VWRERGLVCRSPIATERATGPPRPPLGFLEHEARSVFIPWCRPSTLVAGGKHPFTNVDRIRSLLTLTRGQRARPPGANGGVLRRPPASARQWRRPRPPVRQSSVPEPARGAAAAGLFCAPVRFTTRRERKTQRNHEKPRGQPVKGYNRLLVVGFRINPVLAAEAPARVLPRESQACTARGVNRFQRASQPRQRDERIKPARGLPRKWQGRLRYPLPCQS